MTAIIKVKIPRISIIENSYGNIHVKQKEWNKKKRKKGSQYDNILI